MSIEKNTSNRILIGQSSLQSGDDDPQVMNVYQLPPNLPENNKKRAVCFDHIRDGVAAELLINFDLGGVQFPDITEPQEITTQLSCKGVRCIIKKCGLIVEQFDSTGKKIGQMKASI